ncbi:hypothetical protein ACWDWO_13495 [Actinopolymorpha singaporensis]|uniref:Uncharacterized protein n=1 Tax=Actinopolymorpha singaporensis TaxID=117157 RepID=A0A1H1UY59_9ACTN|nr:hypothetical protein [Actinopolymorpha singaporensis]SDS77467.1 hypothetical protein SAMN04489717_3826 [Actinopolymorpha singaporensis]
MIDLSCPRCGHRAVPPTPPNLVPTFRPPGPDRLLLRWSCPACGYAAVVEAGPHGSAVVELTPEVLLRAGAMDSTLAEELAGPGMRVAGELRPGWICAVTRVLSGEPAFQVPADAEAAVEAAIERLRTVDWTPATTDAQLEPVCEHLDAVAAWVRAADRPDLWPDLQPPVLVRDDPSLARAALARLSAESWYAALPSDAPARVDLAYWLVWLILDASGEIPTDLPDPYEPLIRAYEVGGVVLRSRELRGELWLGPATLRIPPSVEAWRNQQAPRRRTLYSVRRC